MAEARRLPVTIVTGNFHPDFSGTGQLMTDLALGLKARGCDVRVFTARPAYGALGKVPGLEVREGVQIRRLFATQFDKNVPMGRALNAVTFFLSALWVLTWRRNRGPLLIVSNPPFLGFLGYLLKVLRGQHYVYVVHDVFPDLAVTLKVIRPDSPLRRVWDVLNYLVVTNASRIVVLSDAMKALIVKKGRGAPAVAERTRVIHNWADEGFIRPLPKSENRFAREHHLEKSFVVLYSGNMGLSHDLESLIEAAERLKSRDIVFLFVGEGGKRRRLEALARDRCLDKVRFLPFQSREQFRYSVTCSDISVVALERGVEGISMPSKLYTIMASGRPVVALVESGFEVARIIENARCGRSVDPSDVDGLVRIIDDYESNRERCARDGLQARRYFEEHFTRERALREYVEVLESSQDREDPRLDLRAQEGGSEPVAG